MAIIVPKLSDNHTLVQIHNQLMNDIMACDNMIGFEPEEDDTDQDIDYRAELEEMIQQLGNLEEVMSLKRDVDCDCFYTGKDHQ